jgi:hypothetical protein
MNLLRRQTQLIRQLGLRDAEKAPAGVNAGTNVMVQCSKTNFLLRHFLWDSGVERESVGLQSAWVKQSAMAIRSRHPKLFCKRFKRPSSPCDFLFEVDPKRWTGNGAT